MNKIIIIIILSVCFSCKKNSYQLKDESKVKLSLSDNIIQGDSINGSVSFKLNLDTIKLSEKDKRFTILYLLIDDVEASDIIDIKSKKHTMFIEKDKGKIDFNCVFKKLGDNYFTGIIEDEVFLSNYNNTGKTRIISNYTKIVKKVYVNKVKVSPIGNL